MEEYEIIPGESVGPFRLGMTREDVERLNVLPMKTFKSGAELTAVGVKVHYDESGRCAEIEARVFGEGTARFVLAGRSVNNVSEDDAQELFLSISPEIRSGLRSVKWEASDDFLFAIVVKPLDGEPAGSEHPARVTLELGEQRVVFVHAGGGRYAAEVGGERRPIRTRRQLSDISEGGLLHRYEPELSEGDTAGIDTLLRCLALGAERKPLARGIELSAFYNWGHFRQNRFLKVAITIAEDGAVEIDEDIQEQDDSYY